VLVPWLRGYGPTRFLDPATPRSGEQAALGADLLALLDALDIRQATLAGYDWGGRAACIVAALWPARVRGLVSIGGYNIQDIAAAGRPADAESEMRFWYQWYFNTPRGAAGLAADRRALCRLLWRLWSPNWVFDDATFERSAVSFDNPDFVDVVVHSYRHRYGAAAGDPVLAPIEALLAARPPITVPTVVLDGEADGVAPPGVIDHGRRHFTGRYRRALIPRAGHFLPREAAAEIAEAVLELVRG
jgi:pimeloyl-ACP methyl ester carboxylesterase